MKVRRRVVASLFLVTLGGCATLPTGPSVNVLPTQGKPFDLFITQDASCRQWAERQLGVPVQETYDKNLATGAVAGTAIGTVLGAALGSVSGHAGAGALIGGVSGLFFGAATGSNAAQVNGRDAQRRYDNAYVQCMYSYGNQLPGYRVASTRTRTVVSTPPQPIAPAYPQLPPSPPAEPPAAYYPPPSTPPPAVSPVPGDYLPPPEIYVNEAPQFVYSPQLNAYAAVGVPYDLIYTGNEYFYFYGGRWYRGPYYNGPWAFAPRSRTAPVFLGYRIDYVRRYRDAEFRRYEHDRAHYNGRLHRPEFRGGVRVKVGHR